MNRIRKTLFSKKGLIVLGIVAILIYFLVIRTDVAHDIVSDTDPEVCIGIKAKYDQQIASITSKLQGIELTQEPNKTIEVGNSYIENIELIQYNELKNAD